MLSRVISSEKEQGISEYPLILSLIAFAVIGTVNLFEVYVLGLFDKVENNWP